MVVIDISKSDRARCRSCPGNIEKDVVKIGTAVSNDGYLNVEWHHYECFFAKRAAQYYKRKGKKINILLKLSQFSGQEKLNADQLAKLKDDVNAANLKWGTAAALEKEGIEVPVKEIKTKEPKKRAAAAEEVTGVDAGTTKKRKSRL